MTVTTGLLSYSEFLYCKWFVDVDAQNNLIYWHKPLIIRWLFRTKRCYCWFFWGVYYTGWRSRVENFMKYTNMKRVDHLFLTSSYLRALIFIAGIRGYVMITLPLWMSLCIFYRLGYNERKPVYVNIIRKPLDRLLSYYYFVRYGDNFRPYLKRRKMGNQMVSQDYISVQLPMVLLFCYPFNNIHSSRKEMYYTNGKFLYVFSFPMV